MSPRSEVTRERIQALLEELGRKFRHPARLFLSGGEGLVWRGLRNATKDLDVHYEVDPNHHGELVDVLRRLKEKRKLSIEEAYPGDFIPLPDGAERRAAFVGRYGQVDVFLFDAYSVALSKLARGHARDLEDVKGLLAEGVIEEDELRRLFEAILPRYEAQGVKADPARFRRMLELALGT